MWLVQNVESTTENQAKLALITLISKELESVPKYRILEPPDRVAQLAEHWASNPQVVGSIPTVARHIFQVAARCGYTLRVTSLN